ncbi:MAG TPA: hypothetical protein VIX35_06955 [Vicinamibacterales bacterium]
MRQTLAQAPRVFRAGADHVAVNVVVANTHDRPITELTTDDFEIYGTDARRNQDRATNAGTQD